MRFPHILEVLADILADNRAQEVMFELLGQADHAKLTGADRPGFRIVDDANTVDFRRLRLEPALKQELTFLRRPLDQHREFTADQAAVLRPGNLGLLLHQLTPAPLGRARRHLSR